VEEAEAAFTQAAPGRRADAVIDRAFDGARPTEENAFKVPLLRRTLKAVLAQAGQEDRA